MKPRILALSTSYLPGFKGGGPVRSIANLVDRLDSDFDWQIITSDRDFKTSEPYDDVKADAWIGVGKAQVLYASSTTRGNVALTNLIHRTPHDLLYLNSFFDFRFSVLPVLSRHFGRLQSIPVLIAPRGEFSKGAMALKSWKKRPFVEAARLSGAWDNVCWHASTQHEKEDICHLMGDVTGAIHIARNLSASFDSKVGRTPTRFSDILSVVFLSRISRKKNLDYALRVLARVQGQIQFRIYGPKEDAEYWKECEALIAALPPNIRATYEGPVPGEFVTKVLSENDLFFFPTRGENFGHVFVEAWSAGLAVLTSDQTPWLELEHKGVGWDFPLDDLQAFAQILDRASHWTAAQRQAYRARAIDFANSQLQDDAAVEDNRRMFLKVIREGNGV